MDGFEYAGLVNRVAKERRECEARARKDDAHRARVELAARGIHLMTSVDPGRWPAWMLGPEGNLVAAELFVSRVVEQA